MRIALVHDYLVQYGGAERVLEVFCELFPDAPIYTLLYDQEATGQVFRDRVIHTSFLQKLPGAAHYHRILPILMPLAIEQFDFSAYDVVLSTSASFAKGIITKPKTAHINYCLTPTRFLWDDSQNYISSFSLPIVPRAVLYPSVAYLRMWDRSASERPDTMVAISHFVERRINKYYQRQSEVIYPPVTAEKFYISQKVDEYFLMVGRLVAYKRFDLAISVFNAIEKPLKIIGDGPERKRLEKMAGPTIEFLGLLSDDKLPELYSRAEAVVFPQEEDFGIVPLEAMASGRPVIAYGAGGALETIIDGTTGILFEGQTEIELAQAVGRYYQTQFDPEAIRQHALAFDKEVFKKHIERLISQAKPK